MKKLIPLIFIAGASITSCNMPQPGSSSPEMSDSLRVLNEQKGIKTADINYSSDGVNMKGYVAWPVRAEGKLPVVMVIHEWWGQTEYPRRRARELAELGYYAFAVDMYGDRKTAESPEEAGKLSTPFYGTMDVARPRFEAALKKLADIKEADADNVAAIGYCFGGAMAINMARDGQPLKGVVSFHGNLLGNPADKSKLKAQILALHGGADNFVPDAEVQAFGKQMDSIGAKYKVLVYPGATHAFTNPGADEKAKKYNMPIKYDPKADMASWQAMKGFLREVLGK